MHRGDGSGLTLAEFPLAQQLGSAETVRAEEITLSVPDGRSDASLVNATPFRSADGALKSIVVTLQDLARLEKLERLRSEFLGMVSHELRTPPSSIRGSAVAVLRAARAPDPAEMLQFFRVITEQTDRTLGLIADLLDQGRIETGTLSVSVTVVKRGRWVNRRPVAGRAPERARCRAAMRAVADTWGRRASAACAGSAGSPGTPLPEAHSDPRWSVPAAGASHRDWRPLPACVRWSSWRTRRWQAAARSRRQRRAAVRRATGAVSPEGMKGVEWA